MDIDINIAFRLLTDKKRDLYHILCDQTQEICKWGQEKGLFAQDAVEQSQQMLRKNGEQEYRKWFLLFFKRRLFKLDDHASARYQQRNPNEEPITVVSISKLPWFSRNIANHSLPPEVANKIVAVKLCAEIFHETLNYAAHNHDIDTGAYVFFAAAILRLRDTSSNETHDNYEQVWRAASNMFFNSNVIDTYSPDDEEKIDNSQLEPEEEEDLTEVDDDEDNLADRGERARTTYSIHQARDRLLQLRNEIRDDDEVKNWENILQRPIINAMLDNQVTTENGLRELELFQNKYAEHADIMGEQMKKYWPKISDILRSVNYPD